MHLNVVGLVEMNACNTWLGLYLIVCLVCVPPSSRPYSPAIQSISPRL